MNSTALVRAPDVDRSHVDPVCGIMVSGDSELSADCAESTYVFCSEHCLHKFRQAPETCVTKLAKCRVDNRKSFNPLAKSGEGSALAGLLTKSLGAPTDVCILNTSYRYI